MCRILDLVANLEMATTIHLAEFHMQMITPNVIVSSSPCVCTAFIATSLFSTLSVIPQLQFESIISQIGQKELLK